MNMSVPKTALQWGTAPSLNAFEALMWRMDHHAQFRSSVLAVELLDRDPEPSRFRTTHTWCVQAVPRLRQKLEDHPPALPRWVDDENFILDEHLQIESLPPGSPFRKALDYAQAYAIEDFPRNKPLWSARLLTGLEGGRAVYILKLHHALSDGIGIIQLLSYFHSRQPEVSHRPIPHVDSRMPEPQAQTSTGRARQMAQHLRMLLDTRLEEPLISHLARHAASLRRVLFAEPTPPSPLLSRRSHAWRYEAFELSLTQLKEAAKSCGSSLNDAFVAGLLGAMRLYHEHFGTPVEEIPIMIPISLRSDLSGGGGNHFAPGALAGPVSEPDPSKRMRAIGAQVARLRNEPALGAPLALMPVLARLPSGLVAKAMGRQLAATDLQISNVPGIRERIYLAGAEVQKLFPYAPLPGCPGMVTLVSHGDTACVGLNLDTEAIAEPDIFMCCLRKGFDEVLALSNRGGVASITT